MKRLTTALLILLAAALSNPARARPAAASTIGPEPLFTPLDLHPADMSSAVAPRSAAGALPRVFGPGVSSVADPSQISMPSVLTPSLPGVSDPGNVVGKAGTGFFVGGNGTLLTAAHVVKDCVRMQIISKYVPRTWVSLLASDDANDLAILKAPDVHPSAVLRIATSGPSSARLFILGFPAEAGLTVAAETWGVVENQKFPASVGSLANPRELLWLAAPGVTHGYSGGPIFDPKLGAVVGMVKGEVDGGYLRLVRDMPTAGIAIGPGTSQIAELLRHSVPYASVNLVSSPGDAGQDAVRRATVHVLCWH